MKFKVYECEHKVTQTGKELKKLVLQGEGKQYPDKNVTMWSNDPLFNTIKVGDTVEGELDIKESAVPNPHGGFYKNKTLHTGVTQAKEDYEDLRSRLWNLEQWAKSKGYGSQTAPAPTPQQAAEEEINPEDIPF